jgi:dTDP-glucose pyrophosphorylase
MKIDNWKDVIIKDNCKIKDIIKNINLTSKKISIIVDSKDNFKGIVTDGDIRRGLVKGYELRDSVKKIIKRKPLIASAQLKYSDAKKIMEKNKIDYIPIINKQNKVTGIFDNKRDMNGLNLKKIPFVIMAGGFGKRLHPMTIDIPKPMIKIDEKSIIEKIIDKAMQEGFRNFYIIGHYKINLLKRHLGNGKKLNISISYFEEKKPLGTAGGLFFLKKLKFKKFLITNCDILTDANYAGICDYNTETTSSATIAVRKNKFTLPFGVINSDGSNFLSVAEKPKTFYTVNAGVYVINKSLIKYIKKTYMQMTDFLNFCKEKKNKISIYPLHEDWADIGSKNELKKAKRKLKNHKFVKKSK